MVCGGEVCVGGGIPVNSCARQASQHSMVGEPCLVQHNHHGKTNGDGKPNLDTSKHDSQPGSVEDQPVKLVDLHGTQDTSAHWTQTATTGSRLLSTQLHTCKRQAQQAQTC